MKLLLIGISIGLVFGVLLTFTYFSLATFFAVNAEARNKKTADNGHGRRGGEDTMVEQKMKAKAGR